MLWHTRRIVTPKKGNSAKFSAYTCQVERAPALTVRSLSTRRHVHPRQPQHPRQLQQLGRKTCCASVSEQPTQPPAVAHEIRISSPEAQCALTGSSEIIFSVGSVRRATPASCLSLCRAGACLTAARHQLRDSLAVVVATVAPSGAGRVIGALHACADDMDRSILGLAWCGADMMCSWHAGCRCPGQARRPSIG